MLGLLLSGKAKLSRWPRFALEDVHRFVGLLAGTFIFIHVGALLVDSYLPFSLTNILVPGTAPYRPVSVAFGVIAAELLVALAVTNHYRKALSYRFWFTYNPARLCMETSVSGCSAPSTCSVAVSARSNNGAASSYNLRLQ